MEALYKGWVILLLERIRQGRECLQSDAVGMVVPVCTKRAMGNLQP